MVRKAGRPRKDSAELDVHLTEDEKMQIKEYMLTALSGEKVGEMEPLKSKAFADLVIFALSKKKDSKVKDSEDSSVEDFDEEFFKNYE